MSRQSVFSRLGPRVEESTDQITDPTAPSHPPGLGLRCLDDEIRQRREQPKERNRSRKHANSGAKEPRKPTFSPQKTGAKILQRTISEIQQQQNRQLASPQDPNALKQKLKQLEQERLAAQELAETLMLQQQALLAEKQKTQAENAQLLAEREHLLERVTYLEYRDDDGVSDLGSPSVYAGSETTPTLGTKSRSIYAHSPDGQDEHEDLFGTEENLSLEKLQL